jgi:hypothetical protein
VGRTPSLLFMSLPFHYPFRYELTKLRQLQRILFFVIETNQVDKRVFLTSSLFWMSSLK